MTMRNIMKRLFLTGIILFILTLLCVGTAPARDSGKYGKKLKVLEGMLFSNLAKASGDFDKRLDIVVNANAEVLRICAELKQTDLTRDAVKKKAGLYERVKKGGGDIKEQTLNGFIAMYNFSVMIANEVTYNSPYQGRLQVVDGTTTLMYRDSTLTFAEHIAMVGLQTFRVFGIITAASKDSEKHREKVAAISTSCNEFIKTHPRPIEYLASASRSLGKMLVLYLELNGALKPGQRVAVSRDLDQKATSLEDQIIHNYTIVFRELLALARSWDVS